MEHIQYMTTPPFKCDPCNFSAPTRSRYNKHLSTQKHSNQINAIVQSDESSREEDKKEEEEDKKEEEEDKKEEEEEDKKEEEEDEYEDEFLCNECNERVPVSWCFQCGREDICENCEGNGGDYGEHEEWVCDDCLPTCLKCEKPLFVRDDECCGEGRSDIITEDNDYNSCSSGVTEENISMHLEDNDVPTFSPQINKDILLMVSMQNTIDKNTQLYNDLREFLSNMQYDMLVILPIITAMCGFYVGRHM